MQAPTPVAANDLFYFSGGYPGGRPIKAIRAGASGDVSLKEKQTSSQQVAWQSERGSAYIPTPIVYGDYLYVCSDRGVLTCYSAKSGEQIYQVRLNQQGAGFSASPVASDGKLFLANEDGELFVVKAGPKYELFAANPMGEALMATPAISNGLIIVRGRHNIFAIGNRNTRE
ncbi:MAG: PQQ-binding-like beta-propeller repeat protein [Blastocatellia bacterium]